MKTRGVALETEMPMVEPGAATLYDMSRYRSDGAITGAVWTELPSGLWVLDFDSAVPSYVVIPASHTQLNFTSEDFSIIARIRPESLTTDHYIYSRGLRNADGYQVLVGNTGKVFLFTSQAAAEQYTQTATDAVVVGTWCTVGVSRAGATAGIYINGVYNVSAVDVHLDPLTSARSAVIGARNNVGADPYNGMIAFLRIFNYALSPGQHLVMHEALKRWM